MKLNLAATNVSCVTKLFVTKAFSYTEVEGKGDRARTVTTTLPVGYRLKEVHARDHFIFGDYVIDGRVVPTESKWYNETTKLGRMGNIISNKLTPVRRPKKLVKYGC